MSRPFADRNELARSNSCSLQETARCAGPSALAHSDSTKSCVVSPVSQVVPPTNQGARGDGEVAFPTSSLRLCLGTARRLTLVHVIAYDLKSPNDTESDYERVIQGLKSAYPVWCHLEKSVWIIQADASAAEVRDTIKKLLYSSDVLFVAALQKNWGSFNLSSTQTN